MMADKNDVIDAIKAFDRVYDGRVVLAQNDNAMEEVVICLRDKDLYDKIVEDLGLSENKKFLS
jgi:hypothetical protein